MVVLPEFQITHLGSYSTQSNFWFNMSLFHDQFNFLHLVITTSCNGLKWQWSESCFNRDFRLGEVTISYNQRSVVKTITKCFSWFSRVPWKFFCEIFILYTFCIMALFKCFERKSFPMTPSLGWNPWKFSPANLFPFTVDIITCMEWLLLST